MNTNKGRRGCVGAVPAASSRRSATAVLLACLAALGTGAVIISCGVEDEIPVVYASDKIELGQGFEDGTFCPADFEFLDERVGELEALFGAPPGDPIRVNVFVDHPIPECRSGSLGCFRGDHINAWWATVPHELVHAVAARVGDFPAFWSEGVAEAFSGTSTTGVGIVDTVENCEDQSNVMCLYSVAPLFVRWVEEEHGIDPILAILRGASHEAAFGESVAETSAAYEAVAPWAYPPRRTCAGPRLLPSPDGGFEEILAISCSSPGASGFDHRWPTVSARRLFDVDAEADFQLDVRGGTGVEIFRCHFDILEERPPTDMAGDVFEQWANLPSPTIWLPGEQHVVHLPPGTYRMIVRGSRDAYAEVTVRLTPI